MYKESAFIFYKFFYLRLNRFNQTTFVFGLLKMLKIKIILEIKNSNFNKIFFCSGLFFIISFFAFPNIAQAATYYLDAVNGNDSNSGDVSNPWQSLAKAQAIVQGGDEVYLSTGTYGEYSETESVNRTGLVTYQALPGNTPTLSGINIYYATLSNANILFKDLSVSSNSLRNLITIGRASGVTVSGCEIHALKWYVNATTPVVGAAVSDSENIFFEDSYIYEVAVGVQIGASSNVSVNHNHIKVKSSTGIKYTGMGTGIVVNNNNIHGENFVPYPADPLAPDNVHQSLISIRGDNITISNNLMHDMANGVMTYEPDEAGGEVSYDNILMENNVIFNIASGYGVRFYNLGENVIVKNNTISSLARASETCPDGLTPDARYRYSTALAVHTLGAGSDGSGLSLYNNIFIGIANIPRVSIQSNNIFWSLTYTGTVYENSVDNNSALIVDSYLGCGDSPKIFEDASFFKSTIDFSFFSGELTNFKLAENSIAINFGNATVQANQSLGDLGSDGFIIPDGPARSSARHSTGAYEYMDMVSPSVPTGLNVL